MHLFPRFFLHGFMHFLVQPDYIDLVLFALVVLGLVSSVLHQEIGQKDRL